MREREREGEWGVGRMEGGMEREVICLFYEHIIIASLQIQRKQTEARTPTVLWTAATNTGNPRDFE